MCYSGIIRVSVPIFDNLSQIMGHKGYKKYRVISDKENVNGILLGSLTFFNENIRFSSFSLSFC